jgi:hypothetical protein
MEPERPIEKLLRDYAKTRREQAGTPPALHPATRRMLQGEVTRQYAGRNQRAEPVRSGAFWARFGWAMALVLGLATAGWLMLPRQKDESFQMAAATRPSERPVRAFDKIATRAANDKKATRDEDIQEAAKLEQRAERRKDLSSLSDAGETAANKQILTGSAAPLSAPFLSAAQSSLELDRAGRSGFSGLPGAGTATNEAKQLLAFDQPVKESEAFQFKTAATGATTGAKPTSTANRTLAVNGAGPTAPAVAAGVGGEVVTLGGVKPEKSHSDSFGVTTPPSVAANTPAPQPPADALAKSIAIPNQRFFRITNSALVSTDGAAFAQRTPQNARKPVLESFEVQQAGNELRFLDSDGSVYVGSFTEPASYSFRASGTNITSKQSVIFIGQIHNDGSLLGVPSTNLVAGAVLDYKQAKLPLTGARISGKAVVGGREELTIDAAAAPNQPLR